MTSEIGSLRILVWGAQDNNRVFIITFPNVGHRRQTTTSQLLTQQNHNQVVPTQQTAGNTSHFLLSPFKLWKEVFFRE